MFSFGSRGEKFFAQWTVWHGRIAVIVFHHEHNGTSRRGRPMCLPFPYERRADLQECRSEKFFAPTGMGIIGNLWPWAVCRLVVAIAAIVLHHEHNGAFRRGRPMCLPFSIRPSARICRIVGSKIFRPYGKGDHRKCWRQADGGRGGWKARMWAGEKCCGKRTRRC